MVDESLNVLLLRACEVDFERREVRRPGGVVVLSEREVALLAYLRARPGRSISRDQLLVDVWGFPEPVHTRAVDNTVMRLRARIESDPARPEHLLTVRGVGYCFVPLVVQAPPPPSGTFVGRDTEVLTADHLLATDGFVTLHGPAGAGKSRLAAELVADIAGRIVDLHPSRGRLDALGRVAAALGVASAVGSDQDSLCDQLGRALQRRGSETLVLDGVDGVPSLVDDARRWRRAAPQLRVLLTTRSSVRAAGERVLALGPLSEDAAVQMLLDRAPVAVEDTPALRRLAQHLDCLPLALALAAPRLEVFSADQLIEAAPQEGLAAVMTGAWESLSEPDRSALRALAALPVAFSLSDARAVLPSDQRPTVLARIERLVRSSWLQRGSRFSILAGTRRFVRQQSSRAELAQADAGALAHLADLATDAATQLRGRDGIEGSHRLAAIASALLPLVLTAPPGVETSRAALAMGPLLLTRGPVSPPLADRLVLLAEAAPTLQGPLTVLRGALLWLLGDVSGAERAFEGCLGGPAGPEAKARLAMVRLAQGRIDAARELCTQAITTSRTPHGQALAWVRAGAMEHQAGDPAAARRALRAALRLYQQIGDVREEARTLGNLALFDLESGRHERAGRGLRRALASAQQEGSRLAEIQLTINLGGLAHLRGRLEPAASLLAEALRLARDAGEPILEAIASWGLGALALELGDLGAARRDLGRALVHFAGKHDVFAGAVQGWLAALEACDLDDEEASRLLREARAVAPTMAASLDALEAVVWASQGRVVDARHRLETCAEPASRSSAVRQAVRVSSVLVEGLGATRR